MPKIVSSQDLIANKKIGARHVDRTNEFYLYPLYNF